MTNQHRKPSPTRSRSVREAGYYSPRHASLTRYIDPNAVRESDDAPKGSAGGQKWITIHPNGDDGKGQPVLVNGDGTIAAGLGGKFNGKKLADVYKDVPDTQAHPRYNAHTATYKHLGPELDTSVHGKPVHEDGAWSVHLRNPHLEEAVRQGHTATEHGAMALHPHGGYSASARETSDSDGFPLPKNDGKPVTPGSTQYDTGSKTGDIVGEGDGGSTYLPSSSSSVAAPANSGNAGGLGHMVSVHQSGKHVRFYANHDGLIVKGPAPLLGGHENHIDHKPPFRTVTKHPLDGHVNLGADETHRLPRKNAAQTLDGLKRVIDGMKDDDLKETKVNGLGVGGKTALPLKDQPAPKNSLKVGKVHEASGLMVMVRNRRPMVKHEYHMSSNSGFLNPSSSVEKSSTGVRENFIGAIPQDAFKSRTTAAILGHEDVHHEGFAREQFRSALKAHNPATVIGCPTAGAGLLGLDEARKLRRRVKLVLPCNPKMFKKLYLSDGPSREGTDWAAMYDYLLAGAQRRGDVTVVGNDPSDMESVGRRCVEDALDQAQRKAKPNEDATHSAKLILGHHGVLDNSDPLKVAHTHATGLGMNVMPIDLARNPATAV